MANFHFETNLGSDLTLVTGTAYFYGLQNGVPALLGSQNVSSAPFEAELDNAAYKYFYVALRIATYDAGNGSVSVGDRNIVLLSVFKHDDHDISIGERETIANTFCFAHFAAIDSDQMITIAASDRDMGIMYGMRNNFIGVDGKLSLVISRSPNAMETNSYAMFNSLANLLYGCIVDPQTYSSFTGLPTNSNAAAGTSGAFLDMVSDPWTNAQEIYDLSVNADSYVPSLPDMYDERQQQKWSSVPNQWTLTVKVNDSGAQNFLIAGPGYVAFDENDRAWLTNNVTQGSPNSCSFCVVLNSDGSPADFSPVFGGGLLGGGFGVCANVEGSKIYFGNFGWGPKQYNPEKGSISVITSNGKLLSPSNGYTAATSRPQGMMFDNDGNLWIASWGSQEPMAPSNETIYNFPNVNSAIVVYLNFNGHKAPEERDILVYEFEDPSPFNCTFDVAFDSQGNAFVANAGGTNGKKGPLEVTKPSSIYKLRINKDDLHNPFIECLGQQSASGYDAWRQVSVNDNDEVFVAAVKSGRVLKFDNALADQPVAYTNNIGRPWGITFDNNSSMYVANFFSVREQPAEEGEQDVRGEFGVTVIRDDDESTAQLMTLPTGGAPVMLANGYHLYGSRKPHSYQPLSRLTGTGIDRVGNLWALNNWKPSAYVDFEANPGGDGVVIFIGAAAPQPQE